ncbi:hypothetical protein [Dickeya poaceiphila]|uniref:Uncharacterized protein n=1 Tax=Dickeya poaceiphila TaxID=568768 RepID=A0A5B8HI32_9GAMM|nr:hypothetical protein [Dickeya poaceiphila]QDX29565.1 hypothetical protein Dpoa569_0001350 [Dickeya poaceiphila]
MAQTQKKGFRDTTIMLISHIETGSILDAFTLKRVLSDVEKIQDEPTKLMISALAYGAAAQHEKAVSFFKEAASYRDEISAQNYLTYLGHTGHFEDYQNEAVRLGREINSFNLCITARNAAYADGDGELTLFFARKAISMISDDNERNEMQMDVLNKKKQLEDFIEVTSLYPSELKSLSLIASTIAKNHNALATSHDYYTSDDGDAAIICNVLCDDAEKLANMDIDIAIALATNDSFASKNLTAWYRGNIETEISAS